MYSALDIAKYVINWFETLDEPITNLKLQMLLYYIQGECLAKNNGRPCFNDDIESWKFGAVIPSVYRKYTIFTSRPILFPLVLNPDFILEDKNIENIICSVLMKYKDFNAWELANMTKEEPPCKDVGEMKVVSKQSMLDCFLAKEQIIQTANSSYIAEPVKSTQKKKKRLISIDYDGVMIDCYDFLDPRVAMECSKRGISLTIDTTQYDERLRYNSVDNDVLLTILDIIDDEYLNSAPCKEMVMFVKNLISEGYAVCFITARNDKIRLNTNLESTNMLPAHPICYLTVCALQKVGINVPVYFTSQKYDLCKMLGVALHIDDAPEQIQKFMLEGEIPLAVPRYEYNQNLARQLNEKSFMYSSVDVLRHYIEKQIFI